VPGKAMRQQAQLIAGGTVETGIVGIQFGTELGAALAGRPSGKVRWECNAIHPLSLQLQP